MSKPLLHRAESSEKSPATTAASDKDKWALTLAVFSTVVSITAILVSGYFAWKQYNLSEKVYDLSEKVFAQSQENLALSTMLDQNAPIHLKPPQVAKNGFDPKATVQILPEITVRYKALLSNKSLIAVTIKSYQVSCETRDGMWSTYVNNSLSASDGAQVKAGTTIDAGKSLLLYIQSTCEIALDAFDPIKAKPMQPLKDADDVLAKQHMNLFGQTPKVQKMPSGVEVLTFTAQGYPSTHVRITTTRDKDFSWKFLWNGNDIL